MPADADDEPRARDPADRSRGTPQAGAAPPPVRVPVRQQLAFATVRVLIDARAAVDPRRTGVGTYTRALLTHLPPAGLDSTFVAWYLGGFGGRAARFAGAPPNLRERSTRLPVRGFQPVMSLTGLPRVEWLAGRADLLLAANFAPPPTAIRRVVVVVHDLAFELMPETAPHVDARWRRSFERGLAGATAVIVPTEATRADLLRLHDLDPGVVHVIPHGVEAAAFSRTSEAEVDGIRRRLGIEGQYVLFIGGLEPRKNLEALVRAFGRMSDDRTWLVVAGGAVRWAPEYAGAVERAIAGLPAPARARVVRTGYVSDADRRTLLAGAEALAYPSRYEGFGFPVLEGFAADLPVLTSTVSSMPEVAGDAALLVDPDDVDAIARGLDEIVGDEGLRAALRAAAATRVASFTWERCARDTMAVLRDAAAPGGQSRPAASR
jgi:glycosyltransferase involved in cell wall biosynthesis